MLSKNDMLFLVGVSGYWGEKMIGSVWAPWFCLCLVIWTLHVAERREKAAEKLLALWVGSWGGKV